MIRRFGKLSGVVLVLLLLVVISTGCAVTPNVTIDQQFWSDKQQTIGVAVAKPPLPAAHKDGAQGLLDIAINNSMASDLEKHLAKQDVTKIDDLAENIVSYLQSKEFKVKRIPDQLEIDTFPEFTDSEETSKPHAHRNFSALKDKYGVDKLILLSINQIGTIRSYYGFIPTSSPAGYASLNGKMINLSNHELEWNQNVMQQVPNAESEWDVPPDYPGLTQAMQSAFNNSRQIMFNNFVQ